MITPVNPIAIANYFIRKSIESGKELTPMKLIKLVYISHGWYLGITGNPLLPEAIEAWQYGPVVPSIYNQFKSYGRLPITELVYDSSTSSYPMPTDNELITFLDKIWNVYGNYDGLQLSALTHQQNTPWYTTWHEQGGKSSRAVMISDDLIKQHYKAKIAAAPANAH
jgi:uncharacterized phage-associated protein